MGEVILYLGSSRRGGGVDINCTFLLNVPRFPKGYFFFEVSQPSPACPSCKASVYIQYVVDEEAISVE